MGIWVGVAVGVAGIAVGDDEAITVSEAVEVWVGSTRITAAPGCAWTAAGARVEVFSTGIGWTAAASSGGSNLKPV
jgi:hypothetical protein